MKIIKNYFFLILFLISIYGCNEFHAGIKLINISDYDLNVVFVGNKVDSVERLSKIWYYYNQKQLSESDYYDSLHDKWILEFRDSSIFNARLDILLDSGDIFSLFMSDLVPPFEEKTSLFQTNSLIKDGKEMIGDELNTYYSKKERSYFYNMVTHNWFEIPLPKNSKMLFKSIHENMMLFSPELKEIRIMYNDIIIDVISRDKNNLDRKKNLFERINYGQLKIDNELVKSKIVIEK